MTRRAYAGLAVLAFLLLACLVFQMIQSNVVSFHGLAAKVPLIGREAAPIPGARSTNQMGANPSTPRASYSAIVAQMAKKWAAADLKKSRKYDVDSRNYYPELYKSKMPEK